MDRRAWARVCEFRLNAAVAYLVMARGTGGDNRTSRWSRHAIERCTGVSRSRAAQAIAEPERAGAVARDPNSKRDHPKYKLVPAHEIPGCEGHRPPLTPEQQRVLGQIEGGWTLVPPTVERRRRDELARWGVVRPREVADALAVLGRAERGMDTSVPPWEDGLRHRAAPYDAEAAAKPDWVWLPNALVDGAGGETPPVELVRQTGDAATLQLLVDLYGAQVLDEDGGIRFRRIRQRFERHRVGERGPFIVWGFVPGVERAWQDAPFVAPHVAPAGDDEAKRAAAWEGFWACWRRLRDLGLVELVAHLVDADTAEGEVVHPLALEGTGLEIEREVRRAAEAAAHALATPGQIEWAEGQGVGGYCLGRPRSEALDRHHQEVLVARRPQGRERPVLLLGGVGAFVPVGAGPPIELFPVGVVHLDEDLGAVQGNRSFQTAQDGDFHPLHVDLQEVDAPARQQRVAGDDARPASAGGGSETRPTEVVRGRHDIGASPPVREAHPQERGVDAVVEMVQGYVGLEDRHRRRIGLEDDRLPREHEPGREDGVVPDVGADIDKDPAPREVPGHDVQLVFLVEPAPRVVPLDGVVLVGHEERHPLATEREGRDGADEPARRRRVTRPDLLPHARAPHSMGAACRSPRQR